MYQRNILLDRALLAVLDATAVFGCALGAVWLRHAPGLGAGSPSVLWSAYVLPAAFAAGAFVALLNAYGLHRRLLSPRREFVQIVKVATAATAVVLAVSFFYRGYTYSRASVIIFFLLSIPVLVGTRGLHRYVSSRLREGPETGRRAAIIGLGPVGSQLGRALLDDPAYYTLIGFVDDGPTQPSRSLDGVRVLGEAADLPQLVKDHRIDEIIVAVPGATIQRQQDLIGRCMEIGVRWRLVPDLAGLRHERVELDSVGGLPVVGLRGSRVVGYNWTLKRAFDFLVASLAGLLLLPVMLVIVLTIKLSSPGPVLYRQTRIGLQGRLFTLFKFRTMPIDSDADVHQRYTADWIFGKTGEALSPEGNGARPASNGSDVVYKIVDDPRVTRVGRALRTTSLDELPQLWNVLRGEMSVVGPRPSLPYEVDRYTEAHKRRFEVLPGITGLWQVSGRNRLSFDDMVRLDVAYIENWSLREDVRILLRTIPTLIMERGR